MDAHIQREGLKLANMNSELRKARSKFLKKRRRVKDEPTVAKTQDLLHTTGFTMKEIRRVLRYIDGMSEDDGPSDGMISFIELDKAFRRTKRAAAGKQYEEVGRALVYRLERLMEILNMSPEEWFKTMDNSQAGKGDGTVSTLELRRGLAALTDEKNLKEFKYSEADLNNLLRYMDPSGDGELDMQEVGDALRRAHMDPQSAKEEEQAGGIIKRLGEIMLERQCRVLDLYRILDEDGSGSITLNELRDGLIKFAQPSGS